MKLFFVVVIALLSINGMEGKKEEAKRGSDSDYKHLGCFKDEARRAIPKLLWTYLLTPPGAVIRKCSELAEKDGYQVFGVQHGEQCFSGPSAEKTYDIYGAADACSNGVGGSWANDVYAFPEQYHVGCYKDQGQDRAFPDLLGTFPADTAVSKCAALSKEKGFPVFAVQNGGECWTGPESELDYDEYGEAENCVNGVGGAWANDVYSLKPYRHVGCFGDRLIPRAIPWLLGIYSSKNAVSNCAYKAKRKGYKAFGVQNGGECYSGNSAQHESTYGKYGKSDKCGGGVGGWYANDVYIFY